MKNENILHQTKYATLFTSEQDYVVYGTPDLVAVLPVLPNGDVVLIEQYRIPVEKRLIELVTGGINPEEDPEKAAIREVKEETGYLVKETEFVGSFFSAPGYITQKAHVYIAYLDVFEGKELESHESDFGLQSIVLSQEEVENFLKENTTHPYLSIALQQLLSRSRL